VNYIYNFISPYGSTKIKKNNTNTSSNYKRHVKCELTKVSLISLLDFRSGVAKRKIERRQIPQNKEEGAVAPILALTVMFRKFKKSS